MLARMFGFVNSTFWPEKILYSLFDQDFSPDEAAPRSVIEVGISSASSWFRER